MDSLVCEEAFVAAIDGAAMVAALLLVTSSCRAQEAVIGHGGLDRTIGGLAELWMDVSWRR